MASWAGDTTAQRYRDQETGRFLSWSTVRGYVDDSLAASGNAMDTLGAFVSAGQLAPADWNTLVREELKQEYVRQYLLGIGGREQMTAANWGSIGGMLADQYRYLDGFAAEIAAGDLSQAQIQARLRMYVNSAREAYERAHQRAAQKAGYDEERWVLGVAEHCDDCLAYEAMGWQPIGTFPLPGSGATRCLTNCACHLEYRKSGTGEAYGG